MQKSTTKSFQETQKIGQNFASEILASGLQKTAVVLALQGDLGAGKTTFLQGFAKGLGIEEVVNSPTFVILKRFKITQVKSQKSKVKNIIQKLKFKNFYHIDLYRVESEKDLEFLNFQEIISNPENIIAIEWPEKISKLLLKNTTLIRFKHLEESKREMIIDKL